MFAWSPFGVKGWAISVLKKNQFHASCRVFAFRLQYPLPWMPAWYSTMKLSMFTNSVSKMCVLMLQYQYYATPWWSCPTYIQLMYLVATALIQKVICCLHYKTTYYCSSYPVFIQLPCDCLSNNQPPTQTNWNTFSCPSL